MIHPNSRCPHYVHEETSASRPWAGWRPSSNPSTRPVLSWLDEVVRKNKTRKRCVAWLSLFDVWFSVIVIVLLAVPNRFGACDTRVPAAVAAVLPRTFRLRSFTAPRSGFCPFSACKLTLPAQLPSPALVSRSARRIAPPKNTPHPGAAALISPSSRRQDLQGRRKRLPSPPVPVGPTGR